MYPQRGYSSTCRLNPDGSDPNLAVESQRSRSLQVLNSGMPATAPVTNKPYDYTNVSFSAMTIPDSDLIILPRDPATLVPQAGSSQQYTNTQAPSNFEPYTQYSTQIPVAQAPMVPSLHATSRHFHSNFPEQGSYPLPTQQYEDDPFTDFDPAVFVDTSAIEGDDFVMSEPAHLQGS